MPATSAIAALASPPWPLSLPISREQRVAPRLQLLGAGLQRLALGLERDEAVDVEKRLRRRARLEAGDDLREILAQERDVEHGAAPAGAVGCSARRRRL